MEVGTQSKASRGKSTLFGLLPGLSRQSHQPRGPGGTPATMSHGEQLSGSPQPEGVAAKGWDTFWAAQEKQFGMAQDFFWDV